MECGLTHNTFWIQLFSVSMNLKMLDHMKLSFCLTFLTSFQKRNGNRTQECCGRDDKGKAEPPSFSSTEDFLVLGEKPSKHARSGQLWVVVVDSK